MSREGSAQQGFACWQLEERKRIRDLALIDNAFQGAFSELGVIWNRNGNSSIPEFFAQDDVTALLPYDRKAVLLQNRKPRALTMDAA